MLLYKRRGGGYKFFKHLRKLFILLTLTCLSCSAFAQNVKPYKVDLNRLQPVSDDKTASFDKATKTFTVKSKDGKGTKALDIWCGHLDISSYNIIRIKYQTDGYGFNLIPDYADKNIPWLEKLTYCPSYLNEMVIPLIPGQKYIDGIRIEGAWNVRRQKFILKEITLEHVDNPVKTNIRQTDQPPVIDTAATGNFNDKISSWDFVKDLGVCFQYEIFFWSFFSIDAGMDLYHLFSFPNPEKKTFQFIHERGFKTVRFQVNPGSHFIDDKYTIDPRFINKIKQCVDWAIEEGLYVIIDGAFWPDQLIDNYNPDVVQYEGIIVNEKYRERSGKLLKAFWTQIAAAFNNSYDEHLIFETTNESGDDLHPEHKWYPDPNCAVCKKDAAIIAEYNQIILDAIRSSGGNNAKRFVMVDGLVSNLEFICSKLFKLPKDKAKDKLIPTVHYYPMGLDDTAKKYYSESIQKQVKNLFKLLDKAFFSKKIPVYISETGTSSATPMLERLACMKDLMAEVSKEGRSVAITHHYDPNGWFTFCDFWDYKWFEDEYINTVLYGAQGKEYPLSEEFLKKNELIVPSIVGKNLLSEPFEIKNMDKSYRIDPEILIRSVPPKYKFEFTVESTGSNAILQVGFDDEDGKWHDLVKEKNVVVKGASIKDGWCIKVTNEVFTISIDEKLAATLEASRGLNLNGQNIIIKSMKVVE